MRFNAKRVIIAGGGTGGHLFPAMAIGETLEKDGMQVKYIGSKHGIEAKGNYIEKNKVVHGIFNRTQMFILLKLK